MSRIRMTESVDNINSTVDSLISGLRLILTEWEDTKQNFSFIFDDDIESGVDIISRASKELKNADKEELKEVVSRIENDDYLSVMLDDVYLLNNGSNKFIVTECYVISDKKLTLKERKAISFSKSNVTIKPEVETGRDIIRIYIKIG